MAQCNTVALDGVYGGIGTPTCKSLCPGCEFIGDIVGDASGDPFIGGRCIGASYTEGGSVRAAWYEGGGR